MSATDDTRAAVDQHWRTAREIHDRVGCWSFISTRNVLRNLARAGTIEAKSDPHHAIGTIARYRLHPCKNTGNVAVASNGSCLRCGADQGEVCR